MMQIGLLGFGVVGRGLYDLTQGREDIRVRKVLCLEDIEVHPPLYVRRLPAPCASVPHRSRTAHPMA